MLRVVTSRLFGSLAAIIGASLLGFVFMRVLPSNPARLIVGVFAGEEAEQAVEEKLGLNEPLYVQYYRYIVDFVQGDWGYSYSAGQDVTTQIGSRLAASAELALYAFVVAFIGAVFLALIATYRQRPVVDAAVRSLSFFGLGTPPFWLALMVLLLFYSVFQILPGPEGRLSLETEPPPAYTHLYTIDALIAGDFSTFIDAVRHLILPVFTLALAPFAFLVRLLRANLLEVSREQYITVGRSKGLGRWEAFTRHALPNAFLPTLTASAIILAQLLAGSVLIEQIFNWPGLGALIVQSILVQDYAVVQAFILLSAVAYVVVNLLVDIISGLIDPRVRRPSPLA